MKGLELVKGPGTYGEGESDGGGLLGGSGMERLGGGRVRSGMADCDVGVEGALAVSYAGVTGEVALLLPLPPPPLDLLKYAFPNVSRSSAALIGLRS